MNTVTRHSTQEGNKTTTVTCEKCGSGQVIANKRGYSFSLMFKVLFSMLGIGLLLLILTSVIQTIFPFFLIFYMALMIPASLSMFLSLPVAILVGFKGRNNIVNGCMNCGHKWNAGSK